MKFQSLWLICAFRKNSAGISLLFLFHLTQVAQSGPIAR